MNDLLPIRTKPSRDTNSIPSIYTSSDPARQPAVLAREPDDEDITETLETIPLLN